MLPAPSPARHPGSHLAIPSAQVSRQERTTWNSNHASQSATTWIHIYGLESLANKPASSQRMQL